MSERTIEDVLESAKGKIANGLVVGFDEDGSLFMTSSIGNVPYMHWVLNRGIFELGLFEKNQTLEDEDDTE